MRAQASWAGIAAQGQVQGQAGQVLGGGLGWQGLGGLIQRPVQGLEEVGVQLLRRLLPLFPSGDEHLHVPHGEHPLQGAHGGEVAQMDGTVPLPVRPGDQTVLDIVVDHGRGEDLAVVEMDQLAGHVGDDLIHVKGQIRQLRPGGGTLLFQPLLQVQKLIQGRAPFQKWLSLVYHKITDTAKEDHTDPPFFS